MKKYLWVGLLSAVLSFPAVAVCYDQLKSNLNKQMENAMVSQLFGEVTAQWEIVKVEDGHFKISNAKTKSKAVLAGPVALVFSPEFMPHEYNVNKLLLNAFFHPDGGDTHALELEYSKPCNWVVAIENASYQAADMACGAIGGLDAIKVNNRVYTVSNLFNKPYRQKEKLFFRELGEDKPLFPLSKKFDNGTWVVLEIEEK